MLSILIGIFALIIGIWGSMVYLENFIYCLKGIFFPSLFFVGIISIIAGVSTLFEKKPSFIENMKNQQSPDQEKK